ncbi:MAG: hypothetical protein WCX22_12915 [Methanoregula sp.]
MTLSLEDLRKKVDLCRQGEPSRKTPVFTGTAEPCQVPSPTAVTAGPRPVYQENFLLVLLLVAGLFCLVDLKMLALAGIFSALLVYYDAGTLHAGEKSGKELLFGNIVTWRPLTWAACVLVIPLIFLAIYTFSRREIFDANN